MKLTVLNPKGIALEDTVDSIVVPTSKGLIGILSNHAPLLTQLGKGNLVAQKGGEERIVPVNNGVLEVNHNEITVLSR